MRTQLAVMVLGASAGLAAGGAGGGDEVGGGWRAAAGNRGEERRARQALAARPTDPALAVAVAKRYLDQAHELGDPRFAGLAMAAVGAWTDDATMPADVLMMK